MQTPPETKHIFTVFFTLFIAGIYFSLPIAITSRFTAVSIEYLSGLYTFIFKALEEGFTYPTTTYSLLTVNAIIIIPLVESQRPGVRGWIAYPVVWIFLCQMFGGGWVLPLWALFFMYSGTPMETPSVGKDSIIGYIMNLWWINTILPILLKLVPTLTRTRSSESLIASAMNGKEIDVRNDWWNGHNTPSFIADTNNATENNHPVIHGMGPGMNFPRLLIENNQNSLDLFNFQNAPKNYIVLLIIFPIILATLLQRHRSSIQPLFCRILSQLQVVKPSAIHVPYLAAFVTSCVTYAYLITMPWLLSSTSVSSEKTVTSAPTGTDIGRAVTIGVYAIWVAGIWDIFIRHRSLGLPHMNFSAIRVLVAMVMVSISFAFIGPGATTVALWLYREMALESPPKLADRIRRPQENLRIKAKTL